MAADDPVFGPRGEPSRHLPFDRLATGHRALPPAPRDSGRVALLVGRRVDRARETPARVSLAPGTGLPGDAWGRRDGRDPDAELTVMQVSTSGW